MENEPPYTDVAQTQEQSKTPIRMILAIFSALFGIGMASQNFAPILIGALQQRWGLSVATAGLVQSSELLAIALASLGLASVVTTTSPRTFALIGCVVAGSSYLLTCIVHGVLGLVLLRVTAGIGAAMCICAANFVLAQQREPDRLYAIGVALASIAYFVFYPPIVYAASQTQGWGAYATEGAWVLALMPFVALLPRKVHVDTPGPDTAVRGRLSPKLLFFTLPILLYGIFSTGSWSFSGTIATALGIGPVSYGYALSAGTALGILSASVASALGTKYGRTRPVACGLFIGAIAALAFFTTRVPSVFFISFLATQTLYNFNLPFMLGQCSAMDSSGRLATAAMSALMIASATAPALAGWAIERVGTPFLGWSTVIAYALSFLIFYLSEIRSSRRQEYS